MSKNYLKDALETLNPRLMASDPWRSIDQAIESLIDKVILELNPNIPEAEIDSTLNDVIERQEAIDYIISKLMKLEDK